MKGGASVGKWIPIEEKLPELHKLIDPSVGSWNESEPVLIIGTGNVGNYDLNEKSIALARLYSEDEPDETGYIFHDGKPGWITPGYDDVIPVDGGKYGTVTHWMPFPKSPEE